MNTLNMLTVGRDHSILSYTPREPIFGKFFIEKWEPY